VFLTLVPVLWFARVQYIFNGDFVDRGYLGVEICMTLFMFALLYPEHMLLNRGNHEERSQNELSVSSASLPRHFGDDCHTLAVLRVLNVADVTRASCRRC
jgi:hypothetical protein